MRKTSHFNARNSAKYCKIVGKIRYFGNDHCKICDKWRCFHSNSRQICVKHRILMLEIAQNAKKHTFLGDFPIWAGTRMQTRMACSLGFRVFVFQMRLRARRPYSRDSQVWRSKGITEDAPEALRKVNFLLAHSQRIRPQWELRRLMHRWPRVNTSSDRWRVGGNLGFRV